MACIKVGSLVNFLHCDPQLHSLKKIYSFRNPGIIIGVDVGARFFQGIPNKFIVHWKNGDQTTEYRSWLGNASERQV